MFLRRVLLLILLGMLIGACTTPGVGTCKYLPPAEVDVQNDIYVERPFEEVWDQLVKGLSKSFYVVNNIEKASRLINLSFSTSAPQEYITGGHATRDFRRGGRNTVVEYDVAAPCTYQSGSTGGPYNNLPVTSTVHRSTDLDGRINIYVAPEGPGTRVTVNCRYIITSTVTASYIMENAFGTPIQRGVHPSSSATATFNTNQPNQTDWGSPEEPMLVSFRSTGKLEREILDLAR